MRGMYGYRRRRFATRHVSATDKRVADFAADLDGDDEDYETRSAAFQRFRRELLEAEREAVLRLRSEGRSGTRSCARSNATSTSKTHAWRLEGWRCATLRRRSTLENGIRRGFRAMGRGKGRGKIAALLLAMLLAMLLLNLTGGACLSQGTQEQNRPAERQNPAEEDAKEANKNVAKQMEETGKEAEAEEGKEAAK